MRIFHLKWPRMKHEENSVRGAVYAHRHGFTAIDLDMQITKDRVIVCTHWARPMRKDRFYDPRKRIQARTPVSRLTWAQVRRLRTRDGYRIRRIEAMLKVCARLGIVAYLEPKGDRRFADDWPWEHIAQVADDVGAHVMVRALRDHGGVASTTAAHRWGLKVKVI